MALSPQVTQSLIQGGLNAVGAGLSAAGKSKDDAAARRQAAQMQFLGQGPGEEPAAYARLAMQRALWEGLGDKPMSGSLGGGFQVPESMRGFVPDMGPGLDLAGAREQMMSRLADPILAEDQMRRRTIQDQALGMAMNAQGQYGAAPEEKKSGGFWSKLGSGLKKVGKIAAPIAVGLIPGVGPALSMALMAGTGAATGAMGGGGMKGALMGAAQGAAGSMLPGALGKVAGGAKPLPTPIRPTYQG